MFSIRRFTIYGTVAVLVFFLISYFHGRIFSRDRARYSIISPSAPERHPDGKFHRKDVPIHFPVQKLVRLPEETPKKLPGVQFTFPSESPAAAVKRKKRQSAVKKTFEKCWKAYKDYAWMHDELKPLTAGYSDPYGGWAATLIDSLDTLWIMGLKSEFEIAVEAAVDIDLGRATTEIINVFETNIRHLGGLLSAFDLSGDKRVLEKAKEFGEMLLKAFDTPNHMPTTRWGHQNAIHSPQEEADHSMLLAEIGSFSLEFAHLSQLTGDMKYYDTIARITQIFAEQKDSTAIPGMFPVDVDAAETNFYEGTFFSLGSMSDSFYEYLPKMHALLGGLDPVYFKLYDRSMQPPIRYNLFRPMTPDEADILISGNTYSGTAGGPILDHEGQNLACFAGGMFALGGKLFQNHSHVDIGRKLTDGCIWAYRAMPTGIMPETFHMVPCPDDGCECYWNERKWKDKISLRVTKGEDVEDLIQRDRLPKGFVDIPDRRYLLRPETTESVFILYRITGEDRLLDDAWEDFESIQNATETAIANAAVVDVTHPKEETEDGTPPALSDRMESFWLSETLKYSYLIFSEPDLIDLDKWVFNTEAHPFKRNLSP